MIPFVTCEISLGQHVCELVFGVNVFDLDLGFQVNPVEHPIKSNSVGSGNMSHCRTSAFYDHLDHCFVVFKHIQQSFLMRRLDVWGNKNQNYPKHWSLFEIARVCKSCEVANELHVCSLRGRPVLYGSDSCFQELQRSDPVNQVR